MAPKTPLPPASNHGHGNEPLALTSHQQAPYSGSVLFLVGVPFGDDTELCPRAAHILAEADVVAAEDTRKAKRLFAAHNIHPKRLLAHHAHNEHESAAGLGALLMEGLRMAYISDAGMPTISDPGFLLAKKAVELSIPVTSVGAGSAVIGALACSGLPADKFSFHGFLPRTQQARKTTISALKNFPETQVFYEAPHRLAAMVADVCTVLGPSRPAVLARELTKTHEEILRGSLASVANHVAQTEARGAYVLVVAGTNFGAEENTEGHNAADVQQMETQLPEHIEALLRAGVSVKQIRDALATLSPLSKKEIYQLALSIQQNIK